jgi:hypothetical protein
MTTYRCDPETGAVYAWGGVFGLRTVDDRRNAKQDFDRMLERRADVFRKPVPFARRLGVYLSETESIDQIARGRLRELPARRFQQHTSAPPPSGSGAPRAGYRGRGLLVTLESFVYIGPRTRKRVSIVTGRTHVSSDCAAVKIRPRAFAAAA